MKTLLLIVLLSFIKVTYGTWMVDVQILNATVLHEVTYDGNQYCCCDACNNNKIFCFGNLTLAAQNCTAGCSCEVNLNFCVAYDGGEIAAECYGSSEFFREGEVFTFFKYSSSNQIIYSLLQFTGGEEPPSNNIIMLNITITEEDNGNQTPMDSIVIPLMYQVESGLSDPIIYTTSGGIVQLALAYRIYCATGYYGDRCNETQLLESTSCRLGTTATANSVSTSVVTSTVTVYSTAGITATPTSSNQQTSTGDEVDCAAWRITTVLLVIIIVFGIGVCCASCCMIGCFWQFKRTKKSNTGVIAYSANNGIITGPGITNPSYEDKNLNDAKQYPMDGYVSMKTNEGSINKTSFPTTTVAGDENYEVMSSPGSGHHRTDFSKLNTPKDLELSHTYEHVRTLDSNITGLSNDYDDEYNKLRR